MVKEEIINFTCDICKNQISVKNNEGYPYKLGWNYIHSFNIQIFDEVKNHINRINEKDKHFCSIICLKKFIDNNVNIESFDLKKEEKDVSYKNYDHTIANPFEAPNDGKPQIVEPEVDEPKGNKNLFRRR